MVNRLLTVHQTVALLQSANPIELLISVAAGIVSIITCARSDPSNVAGSGLERQHSALRTCDQGDPSHCPARNSL